MTRQHWKLILRINARFAGACITGWIAWLCWTNVSADWWQLYVLAVFMGLNCLICALGGLVDIYRLWEALRAFETLRAMGSDPRADRLPTEEELRCRGMIK